MSENRACDLCGLDVGVKPFVLHTPDKQYQFCCEGCRGIYEMLHDIKEISVDSDDNDLNKSRKE